MPLNIWPKSKGIPILQVQEHCWDFLGAPPPPQRKKQQQQENNNKHHREAKLKWDTPLEVGQLEMGATGRYSKLYGQLSPSHQTFPAQTKAQAGNVTPPPPPQLPSPPPTQPPPLLANPAPLRTASSASPRRGRLSLRLATACRKQHGWIPYCGLDRKESISPVNTNEQWCQPWFPGGANGLRPSTVWSRGAPCKNGNTFLLASLKRVDPPDFRVSWISLEMSRTSWKAVERIYF